MSASNTNYTTDNRRIAEILAVVLTGLGKFIFMDLLDMKFVFITVSITAWAIYIRTRFASNADVLNHWGFRKDNFRQVLVMLLPFGLISILVFFIVGYFQNSLNFSWHIIPLLIIYPVWGVIQQFLVIGLVAGNLAELDRIRLKKSVITLLTAILFGAVHYPDHWLMAGTFILALFYCYTYLKARNIFVLGLFHGWLGALFFYTIANRDPFLEVFGKYMP